MDSCVQGCVQTHLFLTANMSHSAFAESKTMETFYPDMSSPRMSKVAHGRVLVSQNGWCRVISWSVVMVSRSSRMVFIFYGGYVHVFTKTYGWGKPRSMSGQMYGGWVEHV